ncbi:hypothetical protein WN943_006316 [Citrus x changshan-huyou]
MIYKIQDDMVKPETSEDKAKEIVSINKEILDVKTSVISSEYSKEISDSEDSKVISDGVRSRFLWLVRSNSDISTLELFLSDIMTHII